MKWESDSESSGFPLHLSPTLSPAADHAHSTDTPLDLTHQVTGGTDTSLTSEDPFDDESSRTVTQAPTAPEVGLMPSRGPLQPDERHHDDSEEDEKMVFCFTEPNEDIDEWRYLTTGPSSSPASDIPPVVFTETSWQEAPPTTTEDEGGAELRQGGTEFLTETELRDSEASQEVVQVCQMIFNAQSRIICE